ncbi:MAG: ribbon-helix-helix domain-containing protein [Limisphaerales bacterium]
MMRTISLKIPPEDLRRIRDRNRSEFIRGAVREKLEREGARQWRPRTATGRKLLALSEKFDGDRLDQSAITEEIRQRRGGLA